VDRENVDIMKGLILQLLSKNGGSMSKEELSEAVIEKMLELDNSIKS